MSPEVVTCAKGPVTSFPESPSEAICVHLCVSAQALQQMGDCSISGFPEAGMGFPAQEMSICQSASWVRGSCLGLVGGGGGGPGEGGLSPGPRSFEGSRRANMAFLHWAPRGYGPAGPAPSRAARTKLDLVTLF